jgi:hypothetical protein
VRETFRNLLLIALMCTATCSLAKVPFDTDFIGKTVVFLYGAERDGTADTGAPIGTGFLVRVPHLNDQDVTVLLVTARHILDPLWARCAVPRNPVLIFVRVNTVGTGNPEKVRYIPVPLENNGNPTWSKHHDDDVDAAVVTLPLMESDFRTLDFRALPLWRLPTDEELGMISIGDDIVSAGVLLELRDTQKNYPVFKFGKISSIPSEGVPTGCGGVQLKIKAWLIAANLVPGNSGSPILYYPPFGENSDITSAGLGRIVLIGVQSSSAVPSDVAFMTPANYIFDIVRSMNIKNADLYRGKPRGQ